MNLIILFEEDFTSEHRVVLRDHRLQHVRSVHRAKIGDTLRVGMLNGKMGEALIEVLNESSLTLQVTLDTTPPPQNLLRPFIQFHLKFVIPTLGRLITGQADAYDYLPESTLGFKTADELAELMRAAGLVGVQYKRFMSNTMAVHWGQKRTD